MSFLESHAYLIRGSGTDVVTEQLEHLGVAVRGNADAYVREYAAFGIDDARELISRAHMRAIGESGRVFIIAATTITAEAQNALLKTIEEPLSGARFFIVVPTPETLLPTVRSRAQIVDIGTDESAGDADKNAAAFLSASPADRLTLLKPILDKGDDDPEKSRALGAGKRDLGAIIHFLASLEHALAPHIRKAAYREGLDAIYRARRYLNDKGVLIKPLLESIALLLPRV